MIKMMKVRQSVRKVSLALFCAFALTASFASSPRAYAQQENDIDTDMRYEGYGEKLALEDSNTAMTWMGFAFCSVVALLGLFKDAKRTHLD
jgi:hypothetical protein